MNKVITAAPRPYLPHEHPGLRDYATLFGQNMRHMIRQRRHFASQQGDLAEIFASTALSFEEKFCRMARYFTDAFVYYAQADYCRVWLPGLPSEQGRESDAIEACTRSLPLLAAWLHYRQRRNGTLNREDEPLRLILRQVFLHGTDRNSKGYWGDLQDYDQRICECADIALSLWLSRQWVWCDYNNQQRQQITGWLAQLNHCRTVDNNWHLFILLTQLVIRALTGNGETDGQRYARIKEFYAGEGWFRDGARGNYDYYNSWAFHYLLFWMDQIDGEYDRQFIRQTCDEFSQRFRYFFTACGFPFFGRSACYRFAAPSALMAQAIQSGRASGQLRRIISCVHDFFIRRGGIAQGTFTQGLFRASRPLLDGYSGAGSSLWSLRTLILMLYGADDCGLWQQPEAALEIEQSSFDFRIDAISARVTGIKETQEVVVSFMENNYPQIDFQQGCLEYQSWLKRLQEQLTGRSTRPKNNLLRKGVTTYSSRLNLFL